MMKNGLKHDFYLIFIKVKTILFHVNAMQNDSDKKNISYSVYAL